MKQSMKMITRLILCAFALTSFVLSPITQAVFPPPDGDYPGGNTAEGHYALLSLTSGGYNTAVGFLSLASVTEGNFNTAVGGGALFTNAGDQNTATGLGALFSNTTGFRNTANGAFALFKNLGAADNTAIGNAALFNNTTGSGNTATGNFALVGNDIGSNNTAVGNGALAANAGGSNNVAIGAGALTSGTGTGNVAIGTDAGSSVTDSNNVICIGTSGANHNDMTFIGNIWNVQPLSGNVAPVVVSDQGQLCVLMSSRRFKEDIKPMDKASEAILAFKPVTFHYKIDSKGTAQFGLIAEEVAEIDPDLVVRDKEGKPYTVRYDQVNAMLLNEFLKEHKKVEEQQAAIADLKSTVAQQQKGMEAVTGQLKGQAAQIQKVSAQIELDRPAPRTVLNKP